MITFDVEAVERIVQGSPKVNGFYNLFFPLNETVAVKASLIPIDGNYERQKAAAEHGLGPETYGLVEFNYLGKKWYGYFTEIVKVFNNIEEWYNSEFSSRIERNRLRTELKEMIGFNFTDYHYGNLGVKNGKLICIDFDDFNTQTYELVFLTVREVSRAIND